MRASAALPQLTTTTLGITDASTGAALPVDGNGNLTVKPNQVVRLTMTATTTLGTSAPTGSFNVAMTTDAVNFTPLGDSGGNNSWTAVQTGPTTSQASVTMLLPSGTYDLQASFRPSANSGFVASSSGLVPVTVTSTIVHNTTTIVAVNPNSITTGDSATLTATVTSNDASGTPQGTVNFYADEGSVKTFIASVQLDANGQGSITRSDWAAQTYTIEADYLGQVFVDAGGSTVKFNTSSGTATLTVAAKVNPQVATSTIVTATPNPIRSDAVVHIVAQVAQVGSSTQALDSTVIFTAQRNGVSGSSVLGQATLVDNGNGTGTAVFDIGGWIPGSYTITAQYFGNIYFLGSSGSTTTLVVNPARPSVTTYLHDAQTYVGDTATLSGRVVDQATGQPVPAGELVTLTANDPNVTGCVGTTDANGVASCQVVFQTGGTYSVSVSYPGDAVYDPSMGVGQIEVDKIPTSIWYTGTTTVPTGAPATLSDHLIDQRSGLPIANASVNLVLNGNPSESCTAATDANGDASCVVNVSEPAGTYQVAVSYGGDAKYLPSSNTAPVVVTAVQPTHLAYVGDSTALAGQPATIAFKLTDNGGNAMAGRQVTLALDGHTYTDTTDANGVATQQVTAPGTAGPYTPTADFGGGPTVLAEPGYLGSDGTGSLQVTTIPTTVTYVGTQSAYGGQPATIAFKLTDPNGSPLANMAVTLTLPDGSTSPATTDANGIASKIVSAPLSTGSYPVSASFGGQLPYLASNGPGSLQVTAIPTTVTYVGDTQVYQGETATLAAKLVSSSTGLPLANEPVTLTLSTGETCTGTTDANGVASCQVVVNEPTTLAGSPYPIAISFGGDAPYLPSTGTGGLAVVAQYPAPDGGFCSTHRCESVIANPTVVSPTQLQILYADDSALPTTASLAPTAVLDGGQQLVVTVAPTSGVTPTYVDTYGGSVATKYEDYINAALPANLSPGQHSVRFFVNDGDHDWDQWTWTFVVGTDGSVTTFNPGPGPITCGAVGVKCESLLADPAVVSNTQLTLVGMDEAPIVTTGAKAPTAVLSNGQVLSVTTSPTSGQPANWVTPYGRASSRYQTLITINLPGGLAPGTYSILVTAYDPDGDVDQWSWPITVGGDGTVTSNTGGGSQTTGKTTSTTFNFNGTAVPAGDTLWFSNVLKASGIPASGATIDFSDQTIQMGSTSIDVPDGRIVFSPTAKTSSTIWDGDSWTTTVPVGIGGNFFASGVGYVLPTNLAGGLKNIVWSGTVESSAPRVTVNWQWSAAAYSASGSDPSTLGVKAADDPKTTGNSDHAGTPENYKKNVVGGATGGGGSNYTGSLSPTTAVKF